MSWSAIWMSRSFGSFCSVGISQNLGFALPVVTVPISQVTSKTRGNIFFGLFEPNKSTSSLASGSCRPSTPC